MSEYKGFITHSKYMELVDLLRHITEVDGLKNKIHHLYTPDTDMDDKICENFEESKKNIEQDLLDIIGLCSAFIEELFELKERD